MILIKLLKLRSLYTWNLFHMWAHFYTKSSRVSVWKGSNPLMGLNKTRIFDPWFQSAFVCDCLSEKNFPHVRFLSALRFSPTMCTRKLAPPDYVNLLERPFSTNAKCSYCISVISRCIVCALAIYLCGIARICHMAKKKLFRYVYVNNSLLNRMENQALPNGTVIYVGATISGPLI